MTNSSAMFKCPICKLNHVIQQYDAKDFICMNNEGMKKKVMSNTNDVEKISHVGWENNVFSTKADVYRNYTIESPKLTSGWVQDKKRRLYNY